VHPPDRAAIQAVTPSFGVELTPVEYRDADEIERGIVAFARGLNDSLIVTGCWDRFSAT
jgi:putative tryptophan/tyrosine transport system substrate-binding protein